MVASVLVNFSNWGVGSSFGSWVWGFRVFLRGLAMIVIPHSSEDDVGSSIFVGLEEKVESFEESLAPEMNKRRRDTFSRRLDCFWMYL